MASMARCALPRGCCLAVVLALAALASPRRLGAAAAAAAESSGPNWHVVSVSSLLPSAVCASGKATASNSSALSVVHRHGPCSPLLARGAAPSHVEILDRDQDRANSIHRKIAGSSTINPARASKSVSLPAHWGISLGTGNYIVSVGLGTPARDFSVVFDTGSDLSWVQCKPCRDCYKQQDPLFDPAQSSTYSAVPCGAQECQELDSQSCSSDNKCRYDVVYGDQSQTDGDLVRDTLTLAQSDTLPRFVFGCGDDDTGLFGKADGLLGLGREKVSLASQAAAKYGAGFSYCLPSSSSATGYLSLGAAAPADARFTAMVTRSDTPSFYYLNLLGIKVAGRAIKIPPTVFATAGTIIDSGTVITRLPSRAYKALRSAFARFMGKYKRAPALSILDTCYDFTGYATVQIPSVELVFTGGATVSLDFSGVLYVSKVSQACLAFASNGDDTSIGILGNTQQRTLAVVYDVANQKIGFAAKGCS
ncbi:aspartyl protease family protein At5g10770-like [Phragmites australis]|uniref:aspartyl protease family protein At5g10770-like n=1 Tax=Phragmites australis TaxID=29695 RepID=UPI002D767CFC|nr:aspartyl protease family protein At5g10770-like [Phragmites australis]